MKRCERPFTTFALIAVAHLVLAVLARSAWAQLIEVRGGAGRPGGTAEVTVVFTSQGSGANALELVLGFDPRAPIQARDGRPACSRNAEIMKESTVFRFLPTDCTHGVDCSQVRAGVISFIPDENTVPIPDGVVFSCKVAIPASARVGDVFPITVDSAAAIFPQGAETDVTAVSHGDSIETVEGAPCPGDADDDGEVTLGEVQDVFNAYLFGCPLGNGIPRP